MPECRQQPLANYCGLKKKTILGLFQTYSASHVPNALQQFHEIRGSLTQKFAEVMFVFTLGRGYQLVFYITSADAACQKQILLQ
jgi:hypothetical protein